MSERHEKLTSRQYQDLIDASEERGYQRGLAERDAEVARLQGEVEQLQGEIGVLQGDSDELASLGGCVHIMRTTFRQNRHAQEWADFIEEHVNVPGAEEQDALAATGAKPSKTEMTVFEEPFRFVALTLRKEILRWWGGFRPVDWTEERHRLRAEVNTSCERDSRLAQLAALISTSEGPTLPPRAHTVKDRTAALQPSPPAEAPQESGVPSGKSRDALWGAKGEP